MTTVLVDVRTPGATGPAAAAGRMEWKPTKRRDAQGYVVLPAPFSVDLTEGQTSIEVAPSGPDWAWKVTEYIDGGITRTVAVPDVLSINYVQLQTVDPLTLLPTSAPSPIWYAYTDGLALSAEQARAAADAAAAAAGTARDGAAGHETAAQGYATAAAGSAATASADADAADLAADQTGADAAAAKQAAQAADGSAIAADGSAKAAAGSAAAAAGSVNDARDYASGFSAGTATALPTGSAPSLTISGPAGDRVLDLGIPAGETGGKGDKGDPGGITQGQGLDGTEDLNTITQPGIYTRSATSTGLLVKNYPHDTDSGVLMVLTRVAGVTVVQEFHSFNHAGGASGGYWRRTLNSGNWGPWRFYGGQRWNETAGRTLYAYDDNNNREQLIYGDTGARDIKALATTAADNTGSVRVSRQNGIVHVNIWAVRFATDGQSSTPVCFLPAGFRPHAAEYLPVFVGQQIKLCRVTADGEIRIYGLTGETITGNLIWRTIESWPAALPGTAYGSIPHQ